MASSARYRSRSRSPYRAPSEFRSRSPARQDKNRRRDDRYGGRNRHQPGDYRSGHSHRDGPSPATQNQESHRRGHYQGSQYRYSYDSANARTNAPLQRASPQADSLINQSTSNPSSMPPTGHIYTNQATSAPTNEPSAQLEASAEIANQGLSEEDLIEQRRKRRAAIRSQHKTDVVTISQPPPPAPETVRDEAKPIEDLSNSYLKQADEKSEDPSESYLKQTDEKSAAELDPMELLEPGKFVPVKKSNQIEPNSELDLFVDMSNDEMQAKLDATAALEQKSHFGFELDYDDEYGHYKVLPNELINNRYKVIGSIGKGTFGTVIRAHDLSNPGTKVAVKIALNNETMVKAGLKEIAFLKTIHAADPNRKSNIIAFQGQFSFKNHLCIVFEDQALDLRALLGKNARNEGLDITAVKHYARQMFVAFEHLRRLDIIHADMKPDNVLVSYGDRNIKICDFGTAIYQYDVMEAMPFLASRFYRAPEVILGIHPTKAMDMWAIGCTLFELFTDKILFRGATNNQMLLQIQEVCGRIPNRVVKKGEYKDEYFKAFVFQGEVQDPITFAWVNKELNFNKVVPQKVMKARLAAAIKDGQYSLSPEELKEFNLLVDLLLQCLQIDPESRLTPGKALQHAIFK